MKARSSVRPLSPTRAIGAVLLMLAVSTGAAQHEAKESPSAAESHRRPRNSSELRYWLENMLVFHRFSVAEVCAATGMSPTEVTAAADKFHLAGLKPPARKPGDPLWVLPYPGGRHPRIGFLDGAVNPQRETKVSVFTPWDDSSYVVVDVPEAVFSNLGLTYLAHTHLPTLWDKQNVQLPRQEWQRKRQNTFSMERRLPNGITFGTKVIPRPEGVQFEMWLRNGTRATLTDLRVQNCVMLKAAPEFSALTNTNKVRSKPYGAVHSEDGRRWAITAFEPSDRLWAGERVPCLHSDPKFPDCAPGETVRIRGWLSFYEGKDIQTEFERLDRLGWHGAPEGKRPKLPPNPHPEQ